MNAKNIIYFILFALVQGCALYKGDFTPLEEKVGAYNKETKIYPEWWLSYDDKCLEEIISIMLKNNFDYRSHQLAAIRASYDVMQQGARLLPEFSSEFTTEKSKEYNVNTNIMKSSDSTLKLSYEIDIIGKKYTEKKSSELEFEASKYDTESIKITIINECIDLYFYLIYLNSALSTINDSLNYYSKMLTIIENKKNFGKSDGLEVEQVKQSFSTMVLRENEIQLLKNETENKLLALIGENNTCYLSNIPNRILNIKEIEINLNQQISVLSMRPDLKASELRLKKSIRDVDISIKGLFPTVTIAGFINSSSENINTTYEYPILRGLLSLKLPFLQWNTIRWDIEKTKNDFEKRKLEYENKISLAINELIFSLKQNRLSKIRLEKSLIKLDQEKKISDYYENRYNAGKVELYFLLNSLISYTESNLAVLKDKYDLIRFNNMYMKVTTGINDY